MSENKNQQKIPVSSSIFRLLKLSGKNRIWIYAIIFFKSIEDGLYLLWAVFIKFIIDAASANDLDAFILYFLILLAIVIIQIPVSGCLVYCHEIFPERFMAIMREKIAGQISVLPIGYLEKQHTGDILSIVNDDLNKIRGTIIYSLTYVTGQFLITAIEFVIIILINWKLALITVSVMPVMAYFLFKQTNPVSLLSQEKQQLAGKANSIAQDALNGLLIIRIFKLYGNFMQRYDKAIQAIVQKDKKINIHESINMGTGFIMSKLPYIFAFGFAGYLVINGHMTFGTLYLFISLANPVAEYFQYIPFAATDIGEGCGAAQRVFNLLDELPERKCGRKISVPVDENTIVRINNLDFAYDEERVLQGINLSVSKGSTAAIVGFSGSGKSTLMKLLQAFYPVSDNAIFLFGHDINDWKPEHARHQMAFVSQDTYLFPVSIAENIACGKPEAAKEEIINAAKAANIHEYIISLPNGYNTPVGERGITLSGGQRQRISLARAVLKNAPLLLLDEPTSALDTESEALVQETLDRLMKECTTLVVAHRLSTIQHADKIYVLEGGRITEKGTYKELMKRNSRFRDLYLKQLNEQESIIQEDV